MFNKFVEDERHKTAGFKKIEEERLGKP